MSSCVNRVVLVGNLGAEPDARFTPTGTQVVTANLATDDTWTDRQGTKRHRTEWHRLVLWRRLAEVATQYLSKGSRIYIEGRLQSRSWEDDHGNRHYLTEVVVSDLRILDGNGEGPAELDLLYGQGDSMAMAMASDGDAIELAGPSAASPGPSSASDDDGLPF
ncbi:MAG: single-stranded DNA-binding protein [Gemmatimonadetes bacterium]|nr:single-stranded DNA-binding protein [Gemmatimonadota bacterium]